MTHDELLAEIDERASYLGNTDGIYIALRAVVELHKPEMRGFPNHPEYKSLECSACGILKTYPCITIQAIEKELG